MDLDEAARAVAKLLRAGRAGDTRALGRLGCQRGSVMLTDAQRTIAAEQGYRTWARLVDALSEFVPTTEGAVHDAQGVMLVPFLPDGSVVLLDEGDGHVLPTGRLSDRQAPLDIAGRIALSKANFLVRNGSVFAGTSNGSRLVLWVDGEENLESDRGRTSAVWWTGTPARAAAVLGREYAPGPAKLVLLAEEVRRATESPRRSDVE